MNLVTAVKAGDQGLSVLLSFYIALKQTTAVFRKAYETCDGKKAIFIISKKRKINRAQWGEKSSHLPHSEDFVPGHLKGPAAEADSIFF